MSIFGKIKQSILNQSDKYRFYEYEYKKNNDLKHANDRLNRIERELNDYKRENNAILDSYNDQLSTLFLFYDLTPKWHLKYNHLLNQELLDFVVNVCEKHDLDYWMDYGALLGSVRHQGFIPWDDDIDLGMLRKDYIKFYRILPGELKSVGLDEYVDIKINISRVKPIPCIQMLYQKNVPGLLAGVDICAYDFIEDISNCNKETYRQVQSVVRQKNTEGMHIGDAVKYYLEEFNISFDKKSYIIPGVDGFTEAFPHYQFYIAKYEQIFPLRKVTFAGKQYNAPNDYAFYLSKVYGDYLSVPKRVHTHHQRWRILREREDGVELYKQQYLRVKEANEAFE